MDKALLNGTIDLVVNKLMNLDEPDLAEDTTDGQDAEANFKSGKIAADCGISIWDWPQGVGLYGMTNLQKARGNTVYDEFLKDWVSNNLQRGLPPRNINTSAPYLALFDLCSRHDIPEWEKMCVDQANWLVDGLPRTEDGGFQHVTTAVGDRSGVFLNEGQLWADTLFMAVLFLAKMGVKYDNPIWIEEATHQYLVHIQYLYERENGLLYHGWTFNGRNNFGRIHWNRGNSWFTYGAVAFLEIMGDKISPAAKRVITDTWKHQVDALVSLQAEDGLWPTVLTDPTSYEETSGSAAIAAGILMGIRTGLLDAGYRPVAEKAVQGLLANIAKDGTVQNVSAGTAMGMNAEHYKNIIVMPMAYGQSLTLLALTESLYL